MHSASEDMRAGVVLAHPDGYGFLRSDAGGSDVYLPREQMDGVLHGDRVCIEVTGLGSDGRQAGRIAQVLERRPPRVVGQVARGARGLEVVPDDRRLCRRLRLTGGGRKVRAGQVVLATITAWPGNGREPEAKVLEVLGDRLSPALFIDMAIESMALPHAWPAAVSREAGGLGTEVAAGEYAGREDLREWVLVTIDGEDTRDFDDAIGVEPEGDGFALTVAIADVSHYVRPGCATDSEARKRGTSVYFPGRAVHMLPEALACGLCSLQPGVDRLAMACHMHVAPSGEVSGVRFARAVIRSRARLTYDEAWQAGGLHERVAVPGIEQVLPTLAALRGVHAALAKARARRGAIAFGSRPGGVRLDERGEVVLDEGHAPNEAHGWVEECMIAANVQAARLLVAAGKLLLSRVHPRPTPERLAELQAFLRQRGLQATVPETITPLGFAELLDGVAGRPDVEAIRSALLRAQGSACYRADMRGHFGLALDDYTHFTSPIRRYPDLMVHRGIGEVLDGVGGECRPSEMEALAAECSQRERSATMAEREVVDRYRCAWLEKHAGETFAGTVTGIKPFGLFVELDIPGATGLVHVSRMNGYYTLGEGGLSLCGKSGRVFRMGDRVQTRVVRASVAERKIDLALADA